MLKIENVITPSHEWMVGVARGMRNSYNSWNKMDTDIQPAYLMNGVLFMEEVFAKYEDMAENLHWHGTETGEHIIKKQDPLSNFQIPDKCKYCGYYYNFLCRAEQCIKDGVIT